MSNLKSHAKFELEKAGLLSKESDYDGMIGEAVLELMETFSKQGHSGMSAAYTLSVFNKLASFKALTPLTSDPSEWIDRTEMSGEPLWQNNRQSSTFSNDVGKTWYDLKDAQ